MTEIILVNSLRKRLNRQMGRAIKQFDMIHDGDKILVAISGGKDSLTLLDLLLKLQSRAPVKYELYAVTVDHGYPGFKFDVVKNHLKNLNIPYLIEHSNIYKTIKEKSLLGKGLCSICSRLRRGVLYRIARESGFTKVALGHHADDIIETLLLNQMFNGEIKAMPAYLKADDGICEIIRPLAFCNESEIADYSSQMGFCTISCACPFGQAPYLKRRKIKKLLTDLENEHPGIKRSILKSAGNINMRFMLN